MPCSGRQTAVGNVQLAALAEWRNDPRLSLSMPKAAETLASRLVGTASEVRTSAMMNTCGNEVHATESAQVHPRVALVCPSE